VEGTLMPCAVAAAASRRRHKFERLLIALVLAGSAAVVASRGIAATVPVTRPRLLVAERDPFSGLPALRARWAAGERPSADLPGLALSYLLSGDESFARRALDELRADRPIGVKSSSRYVRYVNRSLTFDWLYRCPCFDRALKDAVAADLVAGAAEMLALQSLRDPAQASYHNYTARELALAVFSLVAVEGDPFVEARAAPLREQAWRALDNILEQTSLVDPEGAYHESTDYMRITWAPLAMIAEVRRTATGQDPASRWSVFRNMGPTYLYKVLPDGSEARDDDNEFPYLDSRDNVVLGYAVHRFKDSFAAWMLQQRAWLPAEWANPVLEFLWRDPAVAPRDPNTTSEGELPRHRLFPGVGHLVLRDGFGPDSTWIQVACGPYFAKHDHLDAANFVVYRKGHLAIDSGADYTDTESPHYLNYYRRTVAHNTLLVFRPGESFFWGENLWPAANDGGQRMDSSRFWNTVRSLDDWRRTRDLWDRCRLARVAAEPEYRYARADATRAYEPSKLERFTRELVHLRGSNALVVLDRVRATDPSYRKAWLLHGVSEPRVVAPAAGIKDANGGTSYRDASVVSFEDGDGRLTVHSLLPRSREVIVRGGPGFEFWTPGDERGGSWGSGQNWPLEPPEGGPLPDDPYLRKMWRTFWGEDLDHLSPSNRRAVVPGAWRMEVSPVEASNDDIFLHVLEIGDRGRIPTRRVMAIEGHSLVGAAIEGEAVVLLASNAPAEAEATLPNLETRSLLLAGLEPRAPYEIQVTSGFAPGSPIWRAEAEAGDESTLLLPWDGIRDARLRLRRLR
jgi:Heparinase II/III-like protein